MSNYTNASIVAAVILVAIGFPLSVMIWRAAEQLMDHRLRFIAFGFAILGLKGVVSVYSIHWSPWHHEFAELVSHGFDLAMVASLSAPIWLRR